MEFYLYVTLDHKTSHKCHFFLLRFIHLKYLNKTSIDVRFVRIGQYLAEIQIWTEGKKKNIQNTEKLSL